MINDVILAKYQKHFSNTILKHANVLANINKSPWGRLLDMTPHDTYSIPIHGRTMTLVDINHKKRGKYQ